MQELYIKMFEFVIASLKQAQEGLAHNDLTVFFNAGVKGGKMLGFLIEMFDQTDEISDSTLDELEVIYVSLERKVHLVLRKKDPELLARVIKMVEDLKHMWLDVLDSMAK